MANRWHDGAELGDIAFWDVTNAGLSATTADPRSGKYCYRLSSSGGINTSYKLFGGDLSEFFCRAAHKRYTGGVIGFSSLGTWLYSLDWDVYNRPIIIVGSTVTPVATLYGLRPRDPNYNVYEFYIKIAQADGRIVIKQNGLIEIDFTGDTQPYGQTTADAFYGSVSTNGVMHLDDLALNDTTGEVDNSWCGDEHYEWHPANSNGYLNQWNGSDGNSSNNFELVDEDPPDGDTTFVFSNTAGQIDAYGVTDFDPTNKVITRIWAENRARDANSLGGQMKLGFRTGGTNYLCADARTLPSVYTKVVGDDALVNPDTGLAWTESDINGLQYVQENEA